MEDYIVRATAADAAIRAFAITSKELVDTARRHHHTTPVMTAGLGRLLSVGAMMGLVPQKLVGGEISDDIYWLVENKDKSIKKVPHKFTIRFLE